MNTLNDRKTLVSQVAEAMGKRVYNDGAENHKETAPRLELQHESPKLVSLEDAIRRSGLRDGMTISFHHHVHHLVATAEMVVEGDGHAVAQS